MYMSRWPVSIHLQAWIVQFRAYSVSFASSASFYTFSTVFQSVSMLCVSIRMVNLSAWLPKPFGSPGAHLASLAGNFGGLTFFWGVLTFSGSLQGYLRRFQCLACLCAHSMQPSGPQGHPSQLQAVSHFWYPHMSLYPHPCQFSAFQHASGVRQPSWRIHLTLDVFAWLFEPPALFSTPFMSASEVHVWVCTTIIDIQLDRPGYECICFVWRACGLSQSLDLFSMASSVTFDLLGPCTRSADHGPFDLCLYDFGTEAWSAVSYALGQRDEK